MSEQLLKIELKIDCEIYAISELLYNSKRNLWEYQREYLSYKLFDKIVLDCDCYV